MAFFKGYKAAFEAVRSAAFGSVGAAYAALGSATTQPAAFIIVSSSLDKDAYLSLDGSTDHLYVPAGASFNIAFESNKASGSILQLPKGSQFYQKRGPGGASGSGQISVMVGYAI